MGRWAPGSRVVFYDDAGQGRFAIRGYWLLRLYRFPADRVHVLDGGLSVWQADGRAVTTGEPALASVAMTEPLGERDGALIATAEEVLAWSRKASAPTARRRSWTFGRLGSTSAATSGRRAAAASRVPGTGSSATSWLRTGGFGRLRT